MLDMIQKGKQESRPKVLLHAVEGFGKSTLGASLDNAIIIQTEDGLSEIDCDSFPLCKSLDDFKKQATALHNEDHEYKNLVIDTADWLEYLICEQVSRDSDVEAITDIPFGKGYGKVVAEWRKILKGFDALSNKGMGILILSHSKVEKIEEPGKDAYDQYQPSMHKKTSPMLREWASQVLFGNFASDFKEVDKGFSGKRKIEVGSTSRVVYSERCAAYIAKNRHNLPSEFELSSDIIPQLFRKGL